MKKINKLLLVGCTALLSVSSFAYAVIIDPPAPTTRPITVLNAGFENGAVNSGSFYSYRLDNSTNTPPWQGDDVAGSKVLLMSDLNGVDPIYTYQTPWISGSHKAMVLGYNVSGTIWQTVSENLAADATYQLKLYHGKRRGTSGTTTWDIGLVVGNYGPDKIQGTDWEYIARNTNLPQHSTWAHGWIIGTPDELIGEASAVGSQWIGQPISIVLAGTNGAIFDEVSLAAIVPGEVGKYLGEQITVKLRDTNTGDVLETHNIVLSGDGTYSFPTTQTGVCDVVVKASHWLAKSMPVTIDADGNGTVDLSLVNGDAVESNEVDWDDYNAVVDAFGSLPGDSNWNANADLDGTGEVDWDDFNIAVDNFGAVGE